MTFDTDTNTSMTFDTDTNTFVNWCFRVTWPGVVH